MSLADLLVKTIPAFKESARSLRIETSNPQAFEVRFRYFLTLLGSELEVIESGRKPEPKEQESLVEVAQLLDHLVREKVVSRVTSEVTADSGCWEDCQPTKVELPSVFLHLILSHQFTPLTKSICR